MARASFLPRPIFGDALRQGAVATGIVLGVGLALGAVRVLPVALAPGVPAGVAPILARGVLGAAAETALVVGPAVGFALAFAGFVARGEARALFAIGASPFDVVKRFAPSASFFAVVLAFAGLAWGREAIAPGATIDALLVRSRDACAEVARRENAPATADVPLLGVSWLCFPNASPIVAGALDSAVFTARSIEIAPDLREVVASDAILLARTDPPLRIHTARATIRNLVPIASASNLAPILRASLLAASAFAISIAAAFASLVVSRGSRTKAFAIAAAGVASSLLVFSSLERAPVATIFYLAVPLAGLAAIAAFAFAARLLR